MSIDSGEGAALRAEVSQLRNELYEERGLREMEHREVERLRNSNSRYRKALNWMRGCFDRESWEYKRATAVLDEEAE